jgi:hypothetical protein
MLKDVNFFGTWGLVPHPISSISSIPNTIRIASGVVTHSGFIYKKHLLIL